MPVNHQEAGLSPPQISSIDAPDQVEAGTEIVLRWTLGGGPAAQVLLDGKSVAGNFSKVKVVADPTAFTLTVSNKAGKAVAQKYVGTHAAGDCVSAFLEVMAPEVANEHPYRADSTAPTELQRVRKNLALLGNGLKSITGIGLGHDPADLNNRLKQIKPGHTPADTLKLTNAEFDRERSKVIWPHLGYLAHGGEVEENHTYRVDTLDKAELDRVRKNMAALTSGLAKIPGFGGRASDLEARLKNVKKGATDEETLSRINAEFDRERENVLQVRVKPGASQPKNHPYRAGTSKPAELERVRKNLAILSSGLAKITGLSDGFEPAKLDGALKNLQQKTTPAHTLDMINHELDQARSSIVSRHVGKIHHGSGPESVVVQMDHPYRAASTDRAELERVRKNFAQLHAGLTKIPGFGSRFDAAEHDRRLKAIKQGATPQETLARFNAEFDWERNNMLQAQVTPPPRPAVKPAAASSARAA